MKRLLVIALLAFAPMTYADGTINLEDPGDMSNATVPEVVTADLSCLNCAKPSTTLSAGAVLKFAPEIGWKLAPYFEAGVETGVTFGKGKNAKTPFRALANMRIGLRADMPSTGTTADVEGATADLNTWTSFEATLALTRVIGENTYENGVVVRTSLYAALGGQFAIDRESNLQPVIALKIHGGFRVQELKTGADFFLGAGIDDECRPAEPVLNPDGTQKRSLQGIVTARMPVKLPSVEKIKLWLVAQASVNLLRDPAFRDVATVGASVGF